MRAAAITKLGDPDVIRVIEAASPKVEPGHSIVKVKAVGLNWLDVMARTEDFGLALPHIAGSDVAGMIESTTDDHKFPLGAEVLVNPAYPCNKCYACVAGNRECQFVGILGLHSAGGYGQYLSVPNSQLFKKPPGMSFEQAAAFPLDYLTAWRMLVTRAQLTAGETVFIWGASGALGVAATQLSHYLGARVIAAVGDSDFGKTLKQLGADIIVNYKKDDVSSLVNEVTDNLGADVVFESVGKATMPTSMKIVRAGGRIVICGTRSGAVAETDFSDLYYKQISIIGSRMGTPTDFREVYSVLANGALDIFVGRTMTIDEISEAHRMLENRNFVGKIVLKHD